MGYLHPLGSAGSIGLGPTSILAGVVVAYELLSKLNSELLHCLLPVAGDSPYKMKLFTIATSKRNQKMYL